MIERRRCIDSRFEPQQASPAASLISFIQTTRKYFLLDPDWVIADLGCGTGDATERLAPLVRQVVAVDREPAMLQALGRRLGDCSNVQVVEGGENVTGILDGVPRNLGVSEGMVAYGNSKLALMTYASELSRRLAGKVDVATICPGPVRSNIAHRAPFWAKLFVLAYMAPFPPPLTRLFLRSNRSPYIALLTCQYIGLIISSAALSRYANFKAAARSQPPSAPASAAAAPSRAAKAGSEAGSGVERNLELGFRKCKGRFELTSRQRQLDDGKPWVVGR